MTYCRKWGINTRTVNILYISRYIFYIDVKYKYAIRKGLLVNILDTLVLWLESPLMLTLLQVLSLQAEQEEHEPVEDHVQDQAAVVLLHLVVGVLEAPY